MTPAHQSPMGPLSLMMAMGMAFLAFLFVPARRRQEPDASPAGPRPAVAPVPFAPAPAAFVPPNPPAAMPPLAGPSPVPAPSVPTPVEAAPDVLACRPEPTPLGQKVLEALEDSGPLRKCDVAALVGIGRGSANRIVDRLTHGGWLRRSGPDTYVLA